MVQQGNVSPKFSLLPATCNCFAKPLDSSNCYQNCDSDSEFPPPLPTPPGQGGQQVVTQILRGQAVSTAGGASPVAGAGAPRLQGQGQVKLTVAQLGQLAQVSQALVTHESLESTLLNLIRPSFIV